MSRAQSQYKRLENLDWCLLSQSISKEGWARVPRFVTPTVCQSLIHLDRHDHLFRSRIRMARYHLGEGDYAYFAEPLPPKIAEWRRQLYAYLAPIANSMMSEMNQPVRYPPTLSAFRTQCRRQGQIHPTPLLLHYKAGGFNCLHSDLYGPTFFPLQAMVMLSQPGVDFEGGEFLLVENRPRQQARGTVLTPNRGDLLIFPVSNRPVPGKRGMLRASIRHGVSKVIKGERWVLGIIFHDSK